jgi:hypothetical protein
MDVRLHGRRTTPWMEEVEVTSGTVTEVERPKGLASRHSGRLHGCTTAWMQDDSMDGGGRVTSGTVTEVERLRRQSRGVRTAPGCLHGCR